MSYNPNQPRVPKGSGDPSGEWTSSGGGMRTGRRRSLMQSRGESFEELERKWQEHRTPPLTLGLTGDIYVTRDGPPPLRSYGARERVLADAAKAKDDWRSREAQFRSFGRETPRGRVLADREAVRRSRRPSTEWKLK